jgi:hypothetical protein
MDKMKSQLTTIALVASLFVLGAAGCAGDLPKPERFSILDSHWGESFEMAKRNQILNPEAGKDLDPVTGLDGEAAEANMEKYRDGFGEKPSERVYNLNLGSISGIGQGY